MAKKSGTKKAIGIEVQLLKAILKSNMSRYEIARKSKVSQAALSLFVNGKRTLTLTSAAKVAKVLGLVLCPANNDTRLVLPMELIEPRIGKEAGYEEVRC